MSSYLVLARKYRPQTFEDVSGQEQVTKTLGNAIKRNKIAHAHLFCGPRGVGKTSIARIFAKCLNCEKGAPTASPCGVCDSCTSIANGTSLAVREIDGASNNSVDNVRDLIDSFRSLPPPGATYKAYIIDEVHMLSTSAFNALLKSLEEPPPHTVFILATTEVHKIPDTVLSRCQRHDFRALSLDEIEDRLAYVAQKDGIAIDADALKLVARLSDGSMRDAQSLLDRVHAFCDGKVTGDEASRALGVVGKSVLSEFASAVFKKDPAKAIAQMGEIFKSGGDPVLFLRELVSYWRDILYVAVAGDNLPPAITESYAAELKKIIAGISLSEIQEINAHLRQGADAAMRSSFIKPALEALAVRVATREWANRGSSSTPSSSGGIGGTKPIQAAAVATKSSAPEAPRAAAPELAGDVVEASAVQRPVHTVQFPQWPDFVGSASKVGGVVFSEQLKRLTPKKFEPGNLHGAGPEFTASYFQKNKGKFLEILMQVTGVTSWNLTFEVSKSEGGSLHEAEKKAKGEEAQTRKAALEKHPSVQALLDAFPGSKISNVTLSEK
jgi:DNA polymerase-3 subunit gamma/tau